MMKKNAFTLVELLVVIGIIAVLISVLLPALNKAREQSNIVKCASNIKQLCTSLTNYAVDNKGKYPPVISASTGSGWIPSLGSGEEMVWYGEDRLGRYLPKTQVNSGSKSFSNPVLVCPNDSDAARSYAVNIWCASAADQDFYNKSPQRLSTRFKTYTAIPPFKGTFWSSGSKGSSNLILVSEKFSPTQGAEGLYYAGPTLGYQGDKAGPRFLGNLAIPTGGRFGNTETELDYSRHRTRKDRINPATKAVGRINIGFADSHVELLAQDELADPTTGKSRLRALWSPYDSQINN